MSILKWYSISILLINLIITFLDMVVNEDRSTRIEHLVTIIFEIPIIIYLFLK